MPLFTVPNAVTLARLACVPLIVWLTYSQRLAGLAVASGLFALCVFSDWLDGYLARTSGTETGFGALMDPLVDKVMILSLLFVFSARGLIPLWLVLVNMVRELAVTAVRHSLSSMAKAVGANWMGKTKFCLQTGFIALVYVHLLLQSAGRRLPGGLPLLFWSLLCITLLSFGFLARFMLVHRGSLAGQASTDSGG